MAKAKRKPERPFVFSNLAISLDGKIATANRQYFPLGTPEDRRVMTALRRRADAIIMGASTLRTYKKFCYATASGSTVKRAARQPANVILSTALEGVSPEWPFFKDLSAKRILFVTRPLSPARRKAFEKSSEIILLPGAHGAGIARAVVKELSFRGMSSLLVEGGGGVMWDFCEADLIDRFHITLTPRILGGLHAPTLVGGRGFEPSEVLNLKLARCRRIGDELYLVYDRP